MDGIFGETLRKLIRGTDIKESELANALSYDTTYISKWINGSKLPSQKYAKSIIEQTAKYLSLHTAMDNGVSRHQIQENYYAELKSAYDIDSSYFVFQQYKNDSISFIDNRMMFLQLLQDAIMQLANRGKKEISILSTLDFFKLFGTDYKKLVNTLQSENIERIKFSIAIDTDDLQLNSMFYVSNLINMIGRLKYIELSIVKRTPEIQRNFIIDDLLCAQILWDRAEEFAAIFSLDKKVINQFKDSSRFIIESAEVLMDSAGPESLKRTNVQLDSYSDKRLLLFYNEPPALLFPEELIKTFADNSRDKAYVDYLHKLSNVFLNRTSKSQVDIITFSSVFNKYLLDGVVDVGNVRQRLNKSQIKSHMDYLSKLMKENDKVRLFLIRDVIGVSEELHKSPSIFVDSYSVNIENSKEHPNVNYHISLNPLIRRVFQSYLEKVVEQPFCTQIFPDELLRYL